MKDSLSIVDSPSLVFTSPFVARQFLCQCPRGFSGPICQYQQDPCLPNPCLSGGTCHQDGITFRCTCTAQFQGEKCDMPRKESCSSAPCKNGGTCQEAPNGGFFCLCRPGFKGLVCQQTADACRPNRCLNGGTCVSENLGEFYLPKLVIFLFMYFFLSNFYLETSVIVQVNAFFKCYILVAWN